MSAGKYNMEIEAGATFTRTITYKDSADTAIDLTGAAVRMQIRDSYGEGDPLVSLSSPSSGITFTSNTGEFVITITATQTDNLNVRQGVYDIEIEYQSGTVERVLEGRVKISPQVTL